MSHSQSLGDRGAAMFEETRSESGVGPRYSRTPLFEASNAARYQRQAIIRQIQERTSYRLICYVSGGQASVARDDVMPFMDLLHNVPADKCLELMLHTPGGDIDVAEKLISMVRNKAGSAQLRIIVPDSAKSAGTLMVLGADCVVMSDSSELGPIDPQIEFPGVEGQRLQVPAQTYIDAYEEFSQQINQSSENVSARIMLGKLDPVILEFCRATKERARSLAEGQLKRGMFRDGGNWTQAVSELLDTKRWQSHSQAISWDDAKDKRIGLHVKYLDPQSESWQMYWQLYCLQRLTIGDRQKLYESDFASLVIGDSPG